MCVCVYARVYVHTQTYPHTLQIFFIYCTNFIYLNLHVLFFINYNVQICLYIYIYIKSNIYNVKKMVLATNKTKQLTVHSGYTFFVSMCVPWELNPQPFALLTQCSTTEPQERNASVNVRMLCTSDFI